jgi:hypothetical protein
MLYSEVTAWLAKAGFAETSGEGLLSIWFDGGAEALPCLIGDFYISLRDGHPHSVMPSREADLLGG